MLLAKKKKPPYFIHKTCSNIKLFSSEVKKVFKLFEKSDNFLKCDEIQNNL